MNDPVINDMNKKFEELTKRCDLLEKTNDYYKQKIELNKTNILILNNQLEVLRKEYQRKINDLKDYFTNQFQQVLQIITPNKENHDKNNNGINFINKNKNIKNKENLYADINLMVEKKLAEFRYDIYSYLGKTTKNESNEKNKIIDKKGTDIIERFENKLFNIILDDKQDIPKKDLNELKKLGTALLIKKKQNPLYYTKSFIEQNMDNNKDLDEITRTKISIKRSYIFHEMEGLSINEINTFNLNEFVKQFREKYGIELEEINENELKKVIEDNSFSEKNTIEAILKKLEYIK